METWKKIVILFCFFLIPLAATAGDSPEQVLKSGVDKILSILNRAHETPDIMNGDNKKKSEDELFQHAETLFDFEAFSMGALGGNWRRFSREQKKEFSKYFARLIAQSYFTKIEAKHLEGLDIKYIKTQMLGATKSGVERADIFSEVTLNGVMTPVDYRMFKKDPDGWKIYDVKIEGVSMVGNYRQQYRQRFNDTPEQFIQEVKEKVEG